LVSNFGHKKVHLSYAVRDSLFLEKLDNKSQEQYTGGSKNFCSDKEHRQMGQATRTTKLVLDLGKRTQGGANTSKHAYLEATVGVLSAARAFYVAFFLGHAEKVTERVPYFSEQHQEMRERLISADKLLTWAEFQTVQTKEHPRFYGELCWHKKPKPTKVVDTRPERLQVAWEKSIGGQSR
jgi:hypothetical protein